ncbi:MAG: hypothetical protein AAFV80_21575, partial [Bacteroidota bacterium]
MQTFISCLLFLCTVGLLHAQVSTTIEAIQMVNINGSTDASTFDGQLVTVGGIVTASAEADNLGVVFIQQEGLSEWAGIKLKSGSALIDLQIG